MTDEDFAAALLDLHQSAKTILDTQPPHTSVQRWLSDPTIAEQLLNDDDD
jgi:hypothetical protein